MAPKDPPTKASPKTVLRKRARFTAPAAREGKATVGSSQSNFRNRLANDCRQAGLQCPLLLHAGSAMIRPKFKPWELHLSGL